MKKLNVFLIISMLMIMLLPLRGIADQHGQDVDYPLCEIENSLLPVILSDSSAPENAIAFSKNNTYIAFGGIDDIVYIYRTSDWSKVTEIVESDGTIYAIDFSYDDQYIAFLTFNSIHIYNTSTWIKETDIIEYEHYARHDVAFSPDGNYIAYLGGNYVGPAYHKVFIHNVGGTWSQVTNLTETGNGISIYDLDWSNDETWIAYGASDDTVYIHWTTTWGNIKELTEASGNVVGVAFSDNSDYIAYNSMGTVYVHDVGAPWTKITELTDSTEMISSLDFSNNDKWLACGSYDDVVYVYNVSNWEFSGEFETGYAGPSPVIPKSNVRAVAFSNNSAFLAYVDTVRYIYIKAIFDCTRTSSASTEKNVLSFTPTYNFTDDVNLKVAVSSETTGIINVTNNTDEIEATEVDTKGELVNNTFWYDSANQDVYIRTVNLTTSTSVAWTVNCTYGMNFNLIIPPYLEVGQYFHSEGFISDDDGNGISGIIAETRLLYPNGTDALSVNPKHNCTNGNYHCTFSTATLIPGIYGVSIEFTDPTSGIVFKEGSTLYLSVDPGSGVHVSTFLHFTFYNNNTGIGIPSESFKIYASTDITIDSTDRIYTDLFGVYTGQTIYYRVDDYFDNQIYPSTGSYQTLEITSLEQFEDVPITWYDLSIKNLNQTIMHFSMENSSRYYNITLFPMDTVHINVLSGSYDITLKFYSTINGSLLETVTDTISISGDAFYIATGYNAMVHVSWYNTNEGLGIPDETLKLYFNDQRQTSQTYWTYINQTIKITVKDYYNFTLFEGNFTITSLYRFLDFGLTFHEFDFTNANDEYFYASFLKDGATRWYEKVVSSGGQKAFMLPSGNYTVRVYNADNSTYVVWTETVNRSKAYLIGTDGVSLIIQGQSVIVGDLLELSEEFFYAFMPDVTIISRNPPMIFSVYDVEGMAFGNDFYMICPPLITIATTRVTTYGNWINSTPMVPGNGSVANGTVTIIRDVLYLSGPGSITWVNITYTSNGTLMQNTSYVPSRIDIYGENLTINASGDISVLRVIKFNSVRKFDWTYFPFSGYGPDLERSGWHSAGIEVINSMPVPLYEVYVIAGFSDESNPDGSSVEVRDTTNGGVILERGPDYDVTDTSIHFNLLSMTALETRAFTIGYYKMQQESYIYDEGTVSIPTYDTTVFDGDSYNTFPVHWTNPHSETFRGALYIKLNFDVPTGIDTTSMRIYDLTNDHELDPTTFIPGDKYIRISSEGMGDVLPGGSRKFDVYFLMETFPGADPRELHLDTEIFMGITPFLLILLAGICCIIIGVALAAWDKQNKDRWKVCVALGIFIIVIVYVLNMMGL